MRRTWTIVGDGVRVTHAVRYTTASTLIVDGTSALLVDPALEPDELAALAADVRDLGVSVAGGVSTHAHWDHLLWPAGLPSAPRWVSEPAAAAVDQHRAELTGGLGPLQQALAPGFAEVTPVRGAVTGTVVPVPWPGPEALLVVHDGHSRGHAAVWLPASAVLLVGDMLSDVEPPLPESPEHLAEYDAGLELLRPFVELARVLVPGHGSPTDRPMDRWITDRRYLDDLLAGRTPKDARVPPED